MLYVVLWVCEGVRCAAILREQSAIENCEEVVSVSESKEKLRRFFFSCEKYKKKDLGFPLESLLNVNS